MTRNNICPADVRQLCVRRCRPATLCLLIALLFEVGCGPPQVGVENYRLIAELRTAISARRSDWLDLVAEKVSQRRDSHELTTEQATAFEATIARARSGHWVEAEDDAIQLAKAQRAPAEDRPRKSNQLTHPKS